MVKKIKLWLLNRKLAALVDKEAYMRDAARFYEDEAAAIRRLELPALEREIEKLEIETVLDNGGHTK